MNPNPPIKGHELINEGVVRRNNLGHLYGGCRCGARPETFEWISAGQMKVWHRYHKAELRAAQ